MKLHVLIIRHRFGDNIYLRSKIEDVWKVLDSYVLSWWSDRLGPNAKSPDNLTMEERRQEYFGELDLGFYDESYQILASVEVDDPLDLRVGQ